MWLPWSLFYGRPQPDFCLWLYLLISHDVTGLLGEPARALDWVDSQVSPENDGHRMMQMSVIDFLVALQRRGLRPL
jgi:hypothetical protein